MWSIFTAGGGAGMMEALLCHPLGRFLLLPLLDGSSIIESEMLMLE